MTTSWHLPWRRSVRLRDEFAAGGIVGCLPGAYGPPLGSRVSSIVRLPVAQKGIVHADPIAASESSASLSLQTLNSDADAASLSVKESPYNPARLAFSDEAIVETLQLNI